MENIFLSVVVPAYNEEKCLEDNIQNYFKYLKENYHNFEIIIVNDGSSDDTQKIAQSLTDKYTEIKTIDLKTNSGKGKAVKTGMLSAHGDYVLFLDADNSTSISHLKFAQNYINANADVVIGSRNRLDASDSKYLKAQTIWKRILGKTGNLLIQFFTGVRIWDTQCGFKIFSKTAAQNIFSRLTLNRWLFDIEALVIAKQLDYSIKIIPIKWENNQDSKVGFFGYLVSLSELVKIKKNLIQNVYEINSNDTSAR